MDTELLRDQVNELIIKFEKDKTHYLAKGYPESQVRIDFLNPLFAALGWDMENKLQKTPHARDVIVEVSSEHTSKMHFEVLTTIQFGLMAFSFNLHFVTTN